MDRPVQVQVLPHSDAGKVIVAVVITVFFSLLSGIFVGADVTKK